MSVYDISGNVLATPTGGKYGFSLFHPYLPEAETSKATWASYTAAQFIENIYEPLRTALPTYISRSVIGKDATNTYDIYQYTFEPDYFEQTIYLQAGVHGYEEDGYIGLARLMQLICNDWDTHEGLAYLRWSCKIVVVPIVNVWSVSQATHVRDNSNGVNLNRDLVNKTQAETIAVTSFFNTVNQNTPVSFAFDFHTTDYDSYGDYMLTVWTGSKNEYIAKHVLYYLARKNAHDRMQSYLTKYNLTEDTLRLPYVGDSTNTGTYAWWWNTLGIPCATVEHADDVWDSQEHTATAITKAVENYVNQTIAHADAKFRILM